MSALLRSVALMLISVVAALAGTVEQAVLQELNLARTNPQAYAEVVAARAPSLGNSPKAIAETVHFLRRQSAVPPLTQSSGLTQAAISHVLDTGPRGLKGHRGTDGSRVVHRVNRFGQWDQLVGENLVYGRGGAREWVICLIVDEGVRDRYHRVNIFKREFRFVGIATGPHATSGRMLVTDFAAKYREGGAAVATR